MLKLIYLSMNFYILSRFKHVSIFLLLEDYKLIQKDQERHIDRGVLRVGRQIFLKDPPP